MAEILKGVPVAAAINGRTASDAEALRRIGIVPTLAVLRVGEHTDGIAYERNAFKRCDAVGVDGKSIVFPDDVTQKEFSAKLDELNNDPSIHGILVLQPLPKQLDSKAMRSSLNPEKDIDGITDASLAGVFTGSGTGFPPCTAQACIEILDYYGIDCAGKHAVVIGRSLVVGKPVAMMLTARNATVTICHSHTRDLPAVTRDADIIIAATGRMESIDNEYFSRGQTVIDVGISWNGEKGKLCGDVVFCDAESVVAAVTPVPGGVGTVTTSVLVSHVTDAAKKKRGL